MKFAKLIMEHLKKNGDMKAVGELEEFVKEFEDATASEDTSAEDMEMFKTVMSFFDEEAYEELLNYNKEEEEEEEEEEAKEAEE